MSMQIMKKLNNGVEIPVIGLGVFQSGEDTANAVRVAIESGYRHIDTAKFYFNEKEVAKGIKESGIGRKEIFITTKIWNDDMRAHIQRQVIEESLNNLETDYVDMILIHWPVAGVYKETWKIMEEYYKKGIFRAIGVSNFHKHHLDDLLKDAEVIPACNQIELHPYLSQEELVKLNREHEIATECWGPLARGKVFEDAILKEIADKYGKTISQIVLRWEIQRGLITIPKSIKENRIIENINIFDFELSDEDMSKIYALNKNERMLEGADPDTFTF